MSFDDDERSVSRSRPVDLYRIRTPTEIHYLTSYVVDVTYQGQVYTATTMSRGDQTVAQDLTGRELIVYLPITHPIVQRYVAFGIPEHDVVVTQSRLQQRSGVALQQFEGFATSMKLDASTAAMLVPSITDDAMRINVPTVSASRICAHVLYDENCTVDRAAADGDHHIAAISGNTITVDVGLVGDGFVFGDVVHLLSGQRRMIVGQSASVFTLDAPFVGVGTGDDVTIAPGCDHNVLTCRDKFSNVINFGGLPNLVSLFDPWMPTGSGQPNRT